MAAKEVVVSTLSVLYTGESDDSQVLTERLKQDKNAEGELVFTPLVALSFMLFVLIYFPLYRYNIGHCPRIRLLEMGYICNCLYLRTCSGSSHA